MYFFINFLVINNGCDQLIININSFLVQSFTGAYVNKGGALSTMSSSNLEIVNDAFTLALLGDGTKILLKINQALLDTNPDQDEALLQPHQVRSFGIIVDDCAYQCMSPNSIPGGQVITSGGHNIPLYFDGWKCYLRLQKPTATDLSKYKVIELTSALPYKPQRRSSRLMSTVRRASVEDWRKRLGYPTFEVTKATLKNTTQHIQTLQQKHGSI